MINTAQILSHLPGNKIKELEIVTQRIAGTQKAEMVILFGSYARGYYKEQRGKTKGKKSDYDILVITTNYNTEQELRAKLRGIFGDIGVHVQLIVETIDFVNTNLEEKQYFFSDIKREGKILYNSGKYELAGSQKLTPTRRREIAKEDFKNWYGTAKKMIDSVRADFRLAAFDLQQVAEIRYTAIEMVFSHYNPYEHDLSVLRRRALEFDRRAAEALPYETDRQRELFDHLNFAYIGGRYRSEKEFPVTKEQIDYWGKEAKNCLK